MKPLNGYILLKKEQEEGTTVVLTPDGANRFSGIVVSVSEDEELVQEGDVVYFDERNATTLHDGPDKYTVIQSSDLIAKK